MKIKISFGSILIQKYILPLLLLILISYMLLPHNFIDLSENYIQLIGFIILLIYFYWGYFRLKEVHLEKEKLFISNFYKEIQIDLSNIESIVESNILFKRKYVWIYFHKKTEFGKYVVFISDWRFGITIKSTKAVELLKEKSLKYRIENTKNNFLTKIVSKYII